MTKKQKIWMWIFIAMFIVPEILCSFLLSFLEFLSIKINPLYLFVINRQFFIDFPAYLMVLNIIEWLGVLGLLIVSVKYKRILLIILWIIILLFLSVELFFGYIINSMGLVF